MTTEEGARLPVHYEFLSEEDAVSGKFVEPSGGHLGKYLITLIQGWFNYFSHTSWQLSKF